MILKDFKHILTINSGSSSIKAALFCMGQEEIRMFSGSLEGIGHGNGRFQVDDQDGKHLFDRQVSLPDHRSALQSLFTWLEEEHPYKSLDAVGHRLVHGGAEFVQPHWVSPELLARLEALVPLAPDHLPHEIKAIQAVNQDFPTVQQATCFDTAFHRSLPRRARLFALPKKFEQEGVQRYGFHGLSCEYILQELEKEAGTRAARGRVIIAHLGGGASMTAVYDGQSIDTTMGLTPLGGLVMGTRCGDLDPGVLLYLMRVHKQPVDALDHFLNRESGLLGVSGISSDMQELLNKEAQEPSAATAIDLFCYQARKYLGALAAALGGLDTLIFTGGIGENATAVRQRICQDMEFLGIYLNLARNQTNAPIISSEDSPVTVRVMKTDEERMIARHTFELLNRQEVNLDKSPPTNV
jgi:acetate kinase